MGEHITIECLLFPGIFARPKIARLSQRLGRSDDEAILRAKWLANFPKHSMPARAARQMS
jgi:hypothetical protein